MGELGPNGWTDQHETWHADSIRHRPHCVKWGPSSPPPKKRQTRQFWATVCKQLARTVVSLSCLSCLSCLSVTLVNCGQTVGRIKMKLGMQVLLSKADEMSRPTNMVASLLSAAAYTLFMTCNSAVSVELRMVRRLHGGVTCLTYSFFNQRVRGS